jgi:hypothetical protein
VKCHPDFSPLLVNYHDAALEKHHGSIYAIWADGTLGYFNAAWQRFAADNGGEPAISDKYPVGSSIFPGMSREFREFYERSFGACLASQEPWRHEYECPSPETRRLFQMVTYPLGREGLLIVNSLLVRHPLAHAEGNARQYANEDGMLTQCWRCQRFVRRGDVPCWDGVRHWEHSVPANVSHSICPICLCHYYPELSRTVLDEVLADPSSLL